MDRIQDQPEEHCQLALRVLSWILKARRPLRIEELQHAVAVEVGDEDIEEGPLDSSTLLVSVCAGLVAIDPESRSFRLVHFTVEEFFKERYYKWFPGAEKIIAETCLTYLSFDTFGQGICREKSAYQARLFKYKLLKYAADNWAFHVRQSSIVLENVRDVAWRFLGDEVKVAAAVQVLDVDDDIECFGLMRCAERVPGAHLVARQGCEQFVRSWQTCARDINVRDSDGRTTLRQSVFREDLEMIRHILDCGVNVNDCDDNGTTALMQAAALQSDEEVELFLERGADTKMIDVEQNTCLHYFFRDTMSHDVGNNVVDLLLKAGADLEALNGYGDTPLMEALQSYSPHITKLLLQRGAAVDVKARNNDGQTLLMMAAGNSSSEEFLDLLITSGSDVHAISNQGETALMMAAKGNECVKAIRLLLDSGAEIDGVDMSGCTALRKAVEVSSSDTVVELLVDSGADVNHADSRGVTALMIAAKSLDHGEHEYVANLLLRSGADVNATDVNGETAMSKVVRKFWGRLANLHDVWYTDALRMMVKFLISWGVNEDNRKKALAVANSYPYPDKELVQMLSTPFHALMKGTTVSKVKH